MLESEVSYASHVGTPTEFELGNSLRKTVADIFRQGTIDTMTVNSVRIDAEKGLGLEAGFYNTHATWKAESKRIIKDEIVRLFTCPVYRPCNVDVLSGTGETAS